MTEMNLAVWLREQIAQTAQDARDAATYSGGIWVVEDDPNGKRWWRDPWDPKVLADSKPILQCDDAGGYLLAVHIARHDPQAVLAQCDAHERLLAEIFAYESRIDGEWGCCHQADAIEAGLCRTARPDEIEALQVLALAYQHRPGYREQWRPQ